MSYLCNIFNNIEITKFYQCILKMQHRKLLTVYENTNYVIKKCNSFFIKCKVAMNSLYNTLHVCFKREKNLRDFKKRFQAK